MNLPTGTVTFLFTDIAGSSRLWEQYPDEMRPALAEHDAQLQAAVQANGGQVVKMRGDGVHAVFSSAWEAVAAAVAGQRAMQGVLSLEGIGRLRVRMGIHTGTAELRDGDYFGPTVNRAARLQDAGRGGQILLSEAAASLTRGGLDEGISLLDLGTHRIKDVPEPEHIFQIVADGLPSEFPPLRAAGQLRSNLPTQVTSFIGRERELIRAQQLLAQSRLVTLTGPGGTGKTRLALQVAAEERAEFRDGAWLVELAPLTEESMIIPAVAGVFSLQSIAGVSLDSMVMGFLQEKEMLLILDNCEHLIEACAELAAAYLDSAPNLKILASSRESLGVPGESILRVPSLRVPKEPEPNLDTVRASEAVQLLVQRASAVRPDFRLTTENCSAVAEICRRLDGIPLAIELAAARFRLFSPQQIAERLSDRFKLLTGGSRTAVPRQQTLRALIDWSYDLLSDAEKALLRRLSVFAGGWSFEAAESIGEGLDVLDLMDQLVSKSLVQVEEAGDETRFSYLETIRQYARDQLFAAGEGEVIRDLHLAYFSNWAREAEEQLGGRQNDTMVTTIRLEADNLRRAAEWGLERDVETAVNLLMDVGAYGLLGMGLPMDEVRRLVEIATAQVERLSAGGPEAESRGQRIEARIHLISAQIGMRSGAFPDAMDHATRAVSLARAHNDKRTLMWGLGVQAITPGAARNVAFVDDEGVYTAAEESLALARELNSRFFENLALTTLGGVELARGNVERGEQLLAEGVLGGQFGTAMSLFQSGLMLAHSVGDPAQALPLFEESYRRFQGLDYPFFLAVTGSEIAHIRRREGQLNAAEALYRDTIAHFQWLGHRPAVAHQLECFAFIALAREQAERAAQLLGAAGALRNILGSEMLPREKEEYEQQVGLLREGMDPSRLDAAWNKGKGMGADAAIAFALESAG